MREQDETPEMEAKSHSKGFLKKAVSDVSSMKKPMPKKAKMSNLKRFGGK